MTWRRQGHKNLLSEHSWNWTLCQPAVRRTQQESQTLDRNSSFVNLSAGAGGGAVGAGGGERSGEA